MAKKKKSSARQSRGAARPAAPAVDRPEPASAVAWALGIALAIQPLVLDLFATDEYETPKLALLRVSSAVVAGLWLWQVLRQGLEPWLRRAVWPLAAYAIAMVLATVTSSAPLTSALGEYGSNAGLQTQLCYLLLCGAALTLTAKQDRRVLLLLIMVGATLSTTMALIEASGHEIGTFFGMSAEIPAHSTSGTFGNPNYFAGYTVIIIPIAVHLVAQERWWIKIWLGSLAAASLIAVLLSGSRTGIACAVLLLVWFMAYLRDVMLAGAWLRTPLPEAQRGAVRRLWAGVAVAVLPALIVGAVLSSNQLARVGRSLQEPLKAFTLDRRHLWQPALDMAVEDPVFGAGLDMYASQAQRYFKPAVYQRLGATVTARRAHNEVLNVLACSGVIGLACWLWLFGGALLGGIRTVRGRPRGDPERLAAFAVTTGLFMGLAFNLLHFVTLGQAPLLFALAGLLLIYQSDSAEPQATLRPPRLLLQIGMAVALLLAIAGAVDGVRWIQADTHLKRSIVANMQRKLGVALDEAEAATRMRPLERRYAEAAAQLQLANLRGTRSRDSAQQKIEAARQHIDRALGLNRAPLTLWIALRVQQLAGRTDEAVALAREAVSRDPTRPGEVRRITEWLLSAGRSDDAVAVLGIAARNAPEQVAQDSLELARRLLASAGSVEVVARAKQVATAVQLIELAESHQGDGATIAQLRQLVDGVR